jgi:hypothetical protein
MMPLRLIVAPYYFKGLGFTLQAFFISQNTLLTFRFEVGFALLKQN